VGKKKTFGYSDLVDAGVAIKRSQIAANPQAPVGNGFTTVNGQTYAPPKPMTEDSANSILGKHGLKIGNLDQKTLDTLKSLKTADAQAAFLGSVRKPHTSWWRKGLDYIGRPFESVINSANDIGKELDAQQQEKLQSGELKAKNASLLHPNLGLLNPFKYDVGAALKAGAHGAAEGITGKSHVTGSDVIQRMADEGYATDRGIQLRNNEQAYQGKAKLNPFFKYGAGFGADVVLDPLTYTGIGTVTKGLKGAEALSQIEKTAVAAKTLQEAGRPTEEVSKLLASHLAPVENLSKKELASLSPAGREIADQALVFQQGLKRKQLLNLRKDMGEGTNYLGKTLEKGKTVGQTLGKLEKPLLKTSLADHITQAAELLGKKYPVFANPDIVAKIRNGEMTFKDLSFAAGSGVSAKQFAKDVDEALKAVKISKTNPLSKLGLTETMLKNASPESKKVAALRLGHARITLPGVAPVGRLLPKTLDAYHFPDKQIATRVSGKSPLDIFNDLFRARAGINGALHMHRNELTNGLGQGLVHFGKNLRSIYGDMPTDVRKGLLSSLRAGATDGNAIKGGLDLTTGKLVGSALEHLNNEFKRLSDWVDSEAARGLPIRPEDLNKWVPAPYRAESLMRAGVNKSGEALTKSASRPGWLMDHILSSEKFSDPAAALFHIHSALTQITAKRTMFETFGREFGVKIPTSVGEGGKETLQHTARTKRLRAQGWRTVKDLPELKGQLFHPDVAHGIERMEKVFSNRDASDGFLRTYEKVFAGVKSSMTIYNPGFTPRTFMGEILLNYLGGMPLHAIPDAYTKAVRVMRGRDRELLGDAKENLGNIDLSRQQIRTANILHEGPNSTQAAAQVNGARRFIKTRFGMLSADQIWHGYLNSGVKSGFASSDLVRTGVDKPLVGQKLGSVSDRVHNISEINEDTGRLAHFIYLIQHSNASTLEDAYRESATEVLKYHLDYSGVTKFENTVSKRAVPFYKWIRLSTPLMVDVLLHNPAKALNPIKALANTSKAAGFDNGQGQGFMPGEADQIVPNFLKDSYPMFGKNTHYFNPTSLFPMAGSADVFDPGASSPLDKLSPLITAPTAMALKAFGKNSNVAYQAGVNNRGGKASWEQLLAGIIPQTKFADQMINPPDPDIDRLERLMMFLGNPGFVSNTARKQKSAILQEKDAAYANRNVVKKKRHIAPHAKLYTPPFK
jgi:hypothetical protein